MYPNELLDLIDKDKIHTFIFILPLVTFILYKVEPWITISYTIILALLIVYRFALTAFKKNAVDAVLRPSAYKLNYIYCLPLFILSSIVLIFAFIYSFILSIINSNIEPYGFILLLAHIFAIVFLIFISFTIRYYKKLLTKNNSSKIDDIKKDLKSNQNFIEVERFKALIKDMHRGFPRWIYDNKLEEAIPTESMRKTLEKHGFLVIEKYKDEKGINNKYMLGPNALNLVSAWNSEELAKQTNILSKRIEILTWAVIFLTFFSILTAILLK